MPIKYWQELNAKRKDYRKMKGKEQWSRVEVKSKNALQHKLSNILLRKEIFSLLGNKCIVCGNSDFRVLQIEHTFGNGNQDAKGWGQTYLRKVLKKIKAGSKDYQLMCANHNWIKKWDNEEIPVKYKDVLSSKEILKALKNISVEEFREKYLGKIYSRRDGLYHCSLCGKYKSKEEMVKDEKRTDGVSGRCKICLNELARKLREKKRNSISPKEIES